MDSHKIGQLFERFAALNPEPRTELYYTNPFTLLVAIVLSAQATDKSVNQATPALFAIADTPAKMASLGEEGIKSYISSIGLYNSKAKNVAVMSRTLLEQHGGEIPRQRELLQTLPGVGRKTANVWLNCVHGEPLIAVDTHVFRVSNRLGLVRTRNPLETELALEKVIPGSWKRHAHHWLILHGRYICQARKPRCPECPVADLCEYPFKAGDPRTR